VFSHRAEVRDEVVSNVVWRHVSKPHWRPPVYVLGDGVGSSDPLALIFIPGRELSLADPTNQKLLKSVTNR